MIRCVVVDSGVANTASLRAALADAGADVITVHAEACDHLHRVLQQIRAAGKRAGVSLNPHTPEDCLKYVMDQLDLILVMSVNPGFGGQKFIPEVTSRIKELRDLGFNGEIEVDGGIDPTTAPVVAEAGATVLVAGSAVFGKPDRAAAIKAIREAAVGAAPVENGAEA